MSKLTALLKIPYPKENDDPWFEGIENTFAQMDAIQHALAENDNMAFIGGGDFSWSTTTNILSWADPIEVRTFTSVFKGAIAAQSFELAEGDALFFRFFRKLILDFNIEILKGRIISAPPTRTQDLIRFAYRKNNTVYLPGGHNIASGDLGPVFEGGLGAGGAGTPSDHNHLPALKFQGLAVSTTLITLPITSPVLLQVRLYRNGARQSEGALDDYTLDLALGEITLIKPVTDIKERFLVDMIRTP